MRTSLENGGILLGGSYLGRMTDDEFFDFCQQHPDLRIERTAQHEIRIMPLIGSLSSLRNARLVGQIGQWWEQHQDLGEVFAANTGFTLPDTSILSPDASWVSAAKWNALTPAQQDKFAPVCPEFVVELKSKTDSLKDLQAKMHDWLRNGARLAWLLDPDTETAYIYRPDQPEPETVPGFDNELSGEAVLPGFRLRLAELR